MSDLDDQIRRGFEWLNEIAGRIADWAGSDQGQQVLEAGNLMMVMVNVADFFERSGWYFPLAPISLQVRTGLPAAARSF